MSPSESPTRRVLVTSPDGSALCARLEGLGWEAHAIPTVTIREVGPGGRFEAALRAIEQYDWIIVTSARGARALCQRLRGLNLPQPTRPRWVAVGPMTAAALAEENVAVEFVPKEFRAGAIVDGLGAVVGQRILLPRADAASPELPQLLRKLGAHVEEVTAYRTIEAPEDSRAPLQQLLAAGIDVVIFTSGSAVRGFAQLVESPALALDGVVVACIGPVTAKAARGIGLTSDVVAETNTTEGLVRTLLRREEDAKHHYVS